LGRIFGTVKLVFVIRSSGPNVAPSSNDGVTYMSMSRFEGSSRRSYHAAATVPSGAARIIGKN
jgi:hypothetical protein